MFKEKKADLVALVDFKFRVPIVDGFAHCVQVLGGRGVWEGTGISFVFLSLCMQVGGLGEE